MKSLKINNFHLTAWGEALLCSLAVKLQILLYPRPDSSEVSELRLGRRLSLSILRSPLTSPTPLVSARCVQVTWGGVITLCSWAVMWCLTSGCCSSSLKTKNVVQECCCLTEVEQYRCFAAFFWSVFQAGRRHSFSVLLILWRSTNPW